MSTNEIIFTEQGVLGIITLNRPESLNSLSLSMIRLLQQHLQRLETDNHIKAVLIHSENAKAFCAGGDIRAMYFAKQEGAQNLDHYFAEEYALNTQIKNFSKPYLAIMHGITMGGGIGISVHGNCRIATEKLMFAMPETGIGFFPDVGGSYFLSRAPYQLGTYFALTGFRLNAHDAKYAGFIDVIINSETKNKIIELLTQSSTLSMTTIQTLLKPFAQPAMTSSLETHQSMIEHCFSANTLEEIVRRLKDQHHPWADETLNVLHTRSPTSLKVTLNELRRGLTLPFNECMQMEYSLTKHFLENHDFFEGVRALLIDKDQRPQWKPATLGEISAEEVNRYFEM